MSQLNFPADIKLKQKEVGEDYFIFDPVRKIDVLVTPEEWVRQHFVLYFIDYLSYPKGLISIEKQLLLNNLQRRPDIVVYNRESKPWMVVECKRPEIKLTKEVLIQVSQYNSVLAAEYMCISNGLVHYILRLDRKKGTYEVCQEFPKFPKSKN